MVAGLSAHAIRRILRYEGGEYRIVQATVLITGRESWKALMFLSPRPASAAPWSFAAWRRRRSGSAQGAAVARRSAGASGTQGRPLRLSTVQARFAARSLTPRSRAR